MRPKTCCYLTDDSNENKKAKDTKKCVIKQEIRSKDYNNCHGANQLENEINYFEKIMLMYKSIVNQNNICCN